MSHLNPGPTMLDGGLHAVQLTHRKGKQVSAYTASNCILSKEVQTEQGSAYTARKGILSKEGHTEQVSAYTARKCIHSKEVHTEQ